MKKSSKVELNTLTKDSLDTTSASQKGKEVKGKNAKNKKKKSFGQAFKKFFRDLFSELKKVSWGKMKSTKNNKGVLSQTGIVLALVFATVVLLTAIDLGLAELLKLLIGVGV